MACLLHQPKNAANVRAIVMRGGGATLTKMTRENERRKPLTSASFAAILMRISKKIQDGLAPILETGGFALVGMVSTIEELAAISIKDDRPLLIIIDSGDETETIRQIEVIKELHPDAQIAVLVGGTQIGRLIPLFQAGAHVCLDRRADPKIIRKSLELVMQG
jgi:DNA-binding NarL/FixJ family response regulator